MPDHQITVYIESVQEGMEFKDMARVDACAIVHWKVRDDVDGWKSPVKEAKVALSDSPEKVEQKIKALAMALVFNRRRVGRLSDALGGGWTL